MTPTTPADASPAAGEVVAWRKCEHYAMGGNSYWEYSDADPDEVTAQEWVNSGYTPLVLKSALNTSRAETDAMRAERDEANAMFDECAVARDASGFLGTVPQCIEHWSACVQALEAEVSDLKAKLEMATKALAPFSERIDDWSKIGGPYEDEEYPPRLFKAMKGARTTLAAIGETKP